ncbi:hypothetical protein HMPREF1548_03170 [Clostridium sp. KLE 1755]|nr:hypothetical protein HMPREF1548_03170 [Clostridium sp. KLE 1755]
MLPAIACRAPAEEKRGNNGRCLSESERHFRHKCRAAGRPAYICGRTDRYGRALEKAG